MRDIAIFFLVFASLPFCVARPYIGILVWSWLSYMNPHRLTWGTAHDFSFAHLVAIATLLGVAYAIIKEKKLPKIPWERETKLLLMLWIMFLITTFFALHPELAWPELQKISKIYLVTFLTIILIDDFRKLKYLMLVITFSLAFYGIKGGIFAAMTGGQQKVFGPGGSFIADNNAIGLAMNMVLPFLYYFAKIERNWWLKRLMQLSFIMTIVSIMFTYSRGALLGLVVVLGLIFLTQRLRTKLVLILLALVAAPLVSSMVPEKWFERVETIGNYEQDGSAMGRIGAWNTAWLVALAKPLTGGGFQVIDEIETTRYFNPDVTKGEIGVHSVYFEVLSENGFITFGIFFLLLLFSTVAMRKIRKQFRETGPPQFRYYSVMIEFSLYAYAVSGMFLELASFDLYYHLVALVIVLKVLARRELSVNQEEEVMPLQTAAMEPGPVRENV